MSIIWVDFRFPIGVEDEFGGMKIFFAITFNKNCDLGLTG
jgi:hypothetical protein